MAPHLRLRALLASGTACLLLGAAPLAVAADPVAASPAAAGSAATAASTAAPAVAPANAPAATPATSANPATKAAPASAASPSPTPSPTPSLRADAAATTASAARPLRVAAQGDGHNAAPMWREVRRGEAGITTVKGAETGVLIQSEGNAWRHLRNGPVTLFGGLLLVIVAGSILGFHAWKGQVRLSAPPTGRRIPRFTLAERVVHNTVAGSFVLLALGGLMLLFGKHLLAPVLGHGVLAVLLQILKPIHNFLGLVFIVGLLAMILMWAKDNVWDAIDTQWIRRAGGLLDGSHVPSGRFNFGEKTWFWFGATMLGLTVSASGLLLDFPAFLALRGSLQIANLVHGIGALLMLLLAFGHIYMGTLGVEGALDAMKTGSVDEVWARDHHAAWLDQVAANEKAAR